MAAKKKIAEVSIVETKQNTQTVTDLEVQVKNKVIGKIHKGEEDRQFQTEYLDNRKGVAVTIEDAVQAIIAEYNLHK